MSVVGVLELRSRTLAADSRTVATWTLAGRLTGFLRIAMLAAVLGPTFFGNLFQTVLLVPYVICELMAGSLITSFLAPRMIDALDQEGRTSAERLANGFLGVTLLVFACATLAIAFAAPVIIKLITLPVADPTVRAQQVFFGVPLLLVVIPQIILYGIIGVGIASQHAHRAFGWATAAPIIENVGLILVLGLNAGVYGVGLDVERVTLSQTLLLGIGSTLAVSLHAVAQWWGAFRLGIKLLPARGWRDARVSRMMRSVLPFCGTAGLNSLSLALFMIVSGQIPGGAVAFHIGATFFNLPIALCARPIAAAQLPILSRHFRTGTPQSFVETFTESLRLTLFIAFPAFLVFFLMTNQMAGAVSLGEMSNAAAIALVATVLFGLAPGIIGESIVVVSTSACYARQNASVPFISMIIRFLIAAFGALLSLTVNDFEGKLLIVSLSYSASVLAAAGYLLYKLLPASELHKFGRWISTTVVIAITATLPIALIARQSDLPIEHFFQRLLVASLFVIPSAAAYLALQYLTKSEELRALLTLRSSLSAPPGIDKLP